MPPVELVFYDENDEEVRRFSAPRVRTKFLKSAIRLSREIGELDDASEEQINALEDFIVELFGNKFTRDELEESSDLFEMFNVLTAVFSRANGLVMQQTRANPTVPSSKKK